VWLHSDGTFPAIVKTVTDGVPMPKASAIPMAPKGASSITEAQVRAVSAYVWRLSHGL
jgi:hypothetical protein